MPRCAFLCRSNLISVLIPRNHNVFLGKENELITTRRRTIHGETENNSNKRGCQYHRMDTQ